MGSSIQGVVKDDNKVYKKRMRNTSARRGLSGGFRVIEYLYIEDNTIYLLDIYSKTDLETISNARIKKAIKNNNL